MDTTKQKPPIYLSYTFAEGAPAYFQTLDGQAGFDMVKASAAIFNRKATVLHASGLPDEPPIEIVCVTDAPINREVAEAIGQDAINYAMETGLLPMRK